MIRALTWLCAASLWLAVPAHAGKFEKLDPPEQMHFRALQVFMDKDQEKAFFKLKERAERDAYLKEIGLWDRFYKYDETMQKMVVNGEIQLGFTRDQLYMAWGPPYRKNRLTGRPAERSELMIFRFGIDKNGYATPISKRADYKAVDRYQMEVIVDDDVVTEMKEKDDWE